MIKIKKNPFRYVGKKSQTLHFDGKEYTAIEFWNTKKEALKYAKNYRNQGMYARVVKRSARTMARKPIWVYVIHVRKKK